MPRDFTVLLWLLKLGAPINLYFLATTFTHPASGMDSEVVLPAQILFAVSAFRCLFPVRYKDNVVFHSSPFSSIFLTRLLATLSEVAFIYLFSHVIRVLNVEDVAWVEALSWLMVLQVLISQGFVWGAILGKRLVLYYYEEIGWAIIFVANTAASAYLYASTDALGGASFLLQLNLLYGAVYLPWQFIHVRALRRDAESDAGDAATRGPLSWAALAAGLRESIHVRNRKTNAEAWGMLVGLTWMVGYWATLIPMWVHRVVVELSSG